jgi:hypothetical protein
MSIVKNEIHIASLVRPLLTLSGLMLFALIAGNQARAEGIEPVAAPAAAPNASAKPALECERFKIYYIDMGTKFIVPPVPIEEHAQKVFCSKSAHLERLFKALEQTKPIKKRADLGRGRIKIVPAKGTDFEAALILNSGEVVRGMNTYLPPKKIVRGAVSALKDEAEKAP